MNDMSPLIVLTTSIGLIAIPVDVALAARRRADELVVEPTDRPTEESTHNVLVSAERIAELFDMDATWFLTRAREGRLPHVRLGRYVRFDPVEIRDFFNRNPDRHANSQETHHR